MTQYNHIILNRHNILTRVSEGLLSLKQASVELSLSYRHTRRLFKRLLNHSRSIDSLTFQRTHPAPNRTPDNVRQKILQLHNKYPDVNNCHLSEIANSELSIKLHPSTIRSILIQANLYKFSKSKKPRPRKRYEKEAFGQLVHIDTSEHLWIPNLNHHTYLILLLDDHSRTILAAGLFDSNTTWNNMLMILKAIRAYGIFQIVYCDNASMFKLIRTGWSRHFEYRTDLEKVQTEIHRALIELGITLLPHPPQSPFCKGKIERIFQFMQDRLTKELKDCPTLDGANIILQNWVKWYNTKHVNSITGVVPFKRLSPSVTKPIPAGLNLDDIFCFKYTRVVKNDNTFDFKQKTYQITNLKDRLYWGKAEIQLHLIPGRCIRIFYKGLFIQQYLEKS